MAPEAYFDSLVSRAKDAAGKASVKFPQPNYVALKIAEEAGEVVRGAVHYAENRMEWEEVEGEIVQLLAMLVRFVTEGDEVNGVVPPHAQDEWERAARAAGWVRRGSSFTKGGVSIAYVDWKHLCICEGIAAAEASHA